MKKVQTLKMCDRKKKRNSPMEKTMENWFGSLKEIKRRKKEPQEISGGEAYT